MEFGIDLGTTNSLIARWQDGAVSVLRNPRGFKDTLPSVVGFRKGRVVVGDPALAYLERDPGCVFAAFKRRMGTSEVYRLAEGDRSITPVELSAHVLRELFTFAIDVEQPVRESVVTIPAAFDAVQADATRQAGLAAGLQRVALLQEPVAASLACVGGEPLVDGTRWLVYDLGGGTFDAAIVRIQHGELRVVDHAGDNYLGGRDFDGLLLDGILLPRLIERTGIAGLAGMKSAADPHNALYHRLLYLAEQARIELSTRDVTTLDLDLVIGGAAIDLSLCIQRAELEALIEPQVVRTLDLVQRMLDRTQTRPKDLSFVLPIGGATYTPCVRTLLKQTFGLPLRDDVNPATAVAAGAAAFAGQQREVSPVPAVSTASEADGDDGIPLSGKFVFARVTQQNEEILVGRIDGTIPDATYRLTRGDGGYDSGLKRLDARIMENLPLVPNAVNRFFFSVVGADHLTVPCSYAPIEIVQGRHSLVGQPLPHDLCVEVDEPLADHTRLERLFASNAILPLRKTFTRTVSKTVDKGSDDFLSINVYEGVADAMPAASRCIGQVRIVGTDLSKIVIQGSDLHLTVEVSESREIKVSALLEMTGQQFEQVFRYESRNVELTRLREELARLTARVDFQLNQVVQRADFEQADVLAGIREDLTLLRIRVDALRDDDVTDAKFQLDDEKRALVGRMAQATVDASLAEAMREYDEARGELLDLVAESKRPEDRNDAQALLARHSGLTHARSPVRYRAAAKELQGLHWTVQWNDPDYQVWLLGWLQNMEGSFSKPRHARKLLKDGEEAVRKQQHLRLASINRTLMGLLPDDVEKEAVRDARRVGIF